MAHWLLMFVVDLIIPVIMTGFGRLFLTNPPRQTNDFYGYRTTMSMKNQDTWDFAHQYNARIWYKWGRIMLLLTVLVMLAILPQGKTIVYTVGFAGMGLQLAALLGTIPVIEKELRKTFDNEGNRK